MSKTPRATSINACEPCPEQGETVHQLFAQETECGWNASLRCSTAFSTMTA